VCSASPLIQVSGEPIRNAPCRKDSSAALGGKPHSASFAVAADTTVSAADRFRRPLGILFGTDERCRWIAGAFATHATGAKPTRGRNRTCHTANNLLYSVHTAGDRASPCVGSENPGFPMIVLFKYADMGRPRQTSALPSVTASAFEFGVMELQSLVGVAHTVKIAALHGTFHAS
jgi:hypothetical protein